MAVDVAENKRLIGMMVAIGMLLLVPLVAMHFSEDVVWSWFDFLVAGVLLGSAALAFEVAARKSGNVAYQAAFGVVIAAVLAVVWVQLAVGIVESWGGS